MIKKIDVKIGSFYKTSTGQLRKVIDIKITIKQPNKKETQKNTLKKVIDITDIKISYLSKSINIANRKFNFGHAKTAPPSIDTFLKNCEKKLTSKEIQDLRAEGILLKGE